MKITLTFSDEAVEPKPGDCTFCQFHVFRGDEELDGGTIGAILWWVEQGYLGDPKDLVLKPVIKRSSTS